MSVIKVKTCVDCILPLSRNEVGLSKKLLGRTIDSYMCLKCLAEYLSCSEEDLQVKIQEFKEQGCALFL